MSKKTIPNDNQSIANRNGQPNPDRAEAVAMRRIVIENGGWLSPLLKRCPLPVLTKHQETVDLSRMHNSENRDRNTHDRMPADYVEPKSKLPPGQRSKWQR
jgi:hypothetical protein